MMIQLKLRTRPSLILEACTLAYAAVFSFVFLLGYLRWWCALPLVVLLSFGLIRSTLGAAEGDSRDDLPWMHLSHPIAWWTGLIAIALLVVTFSGIGGFSWQHIDYFKHDSILRDHVVSAWPPRYVAATPEDLDGFYSTYIAYYLPAAAVGRAFGWFAANVFLTLWVGLGVVLAMLWWLRLVGRSSLWYALLLLFFGGLDFVGQLLTAPWPSEAGVTWWDFLTGVYPNFLPGAGYQDFWLMIASWNIPGFNGAGILALSPLTYLYFNAHHCVPIWPLMFMLFHDVLRRRRCERLGVIWVLMPLCSLLIALATLPFLVVGILQSRMRGLWSIENLFIAPFAALVAALFLSSGSSPVPSAWIWNVADLGTVWYWFPIFWILEFGLFLLVSPSLKANGYRPGWAWMALCPILFVLSVPLKFGHFSDIAMKAVIPAQFVVLLGCATAIASASPQPVQQWRKRLLIGLLVIGAIGPASQVYRGLRFGLQATPPPQDRIRYFNEPIFLKDHLPYLLSQGDTFFWCHLAKPAQPLKPPPNPETASWDLSSPGPWGVEAALGQAADGALLAPAPGQRLFCFEENRVDADTIGSIRLYGAIVGEDGARVADLSSVRIVCRWNDAAAAGPGCEPGDFRWMWFEPYPEGDPDAVTAWMSTNAYWQDEVSNVGLYLEGPAPPGAQVRIDRIAFYAR